MLRAESVDKFYSNAKFLKFGGYLYRYSKISYRIIVTFTIVCVLVRWIDTLIENCNAIVKAIVIYDNKYYLPMVR